MKPRVPAPLRNGDRIGIVAPSSPEKSRGRAALGARFLKSKGFDVVFGAHINDRNGYLAGSDEARAEDLNRMFADKSVDAVMCTRGGFGSTRILAMLDWPMIRRNPKLFVGFSDGTALNCALLAKANLVSFTGALPGVDLWKPEIDPFTLRSFMDAVTARAPLSAACQALSSRTPLRGTLVGGNLAMVSALAGTPYLPQVQRAVWALEDVTEEPYRIDRMLTQLLLAGVLKNAAGIVFGQFAHCEPSDPRSPFVGEVLKEFASRVACPVYTGLQYGHVERKLTLPIGGAVQLARGRLRSV